MFVPATDYPPVRISASPRSGPRIKQHIDDYLGMGVPYVWVLDPTAKAAYSASPTERVQNVTSGVLKTQNPSVELPLGEIFT